ncbi:LysR family transcriptional regulator, partial [Salinicola sp.]|uniref:helix-turn-helix domain-containing protein n=1 Tax=Salinicola sp. TaxID=1978524 RepID=UPI003445CA93
MITTAHSSKVLGVARKVGECRQFAYKVWFWSRHKREESSMPPTLETLMSRLRLRQLRLLMALEECGSIHKAAEQVAISQPGATRALHEVES